MRIILAGGSHLALEFEQYVLDCNNAGRGLRDAAGTPVATNGVVVGIYAKDRGRLDDFQTNPQQITEAPTHWPDDVHFIIAIGDVLIRRRVYKELAAQGARFATLIHPSAIPANNVRFGPGSIFCPGAFAGPLADIGANVIVNTYASVGHDGKIGDHTIFSPYAAVSGKVTLGEGCFLGSKALVTPMRQVGAFSKISAGSVIMRDVGEACFAHGNPAKSRQMFKPPSDYEPSAPVTPAPGA